MLSRLFLGEKAFLAGRIEKEFRNEIKVEAGWRAAAAGSSHHNLIMCRGDLDTVDTWCQCGC